jgi:hypothetical protein
VAAAPPTLPTMDAAKLREGEDMRVLLVKRWPAGR